MNSKNKTLAIVVVIAILVVAFFIYRSNGVSIPGSYSLAEVAKHKDVKSCWTAISGGVYDVTAWIDQHPGGAENILQTCGKDATSLFVGQHDGQARPEAELASFKIGTLSK
jgi:cytochrome b involved in lipid metabolism